MSRTGTPLICWCKNEGSRGKEVYNGFMLSKDKNNMEGIDINIVSCASHKKAYFTCVNGHEFNLRLDAVKAGQWCPECAKNKRVKTRENNQVNNGSKERLLDWCKNNGEFGKIVYDGFKRCEEENNSNGLFIDKILSGSAKKVSFICDKGHYFQTALSSIHTQHSWCKQCYDENKGRILKEKSNLTRIKKGTGLSLSDWCDRNGREGRLIKEAFLRCKDENNNLLIYIDKVGMHSNQSAYFKCEEESHGIQFKKIADVVRHGGFCTQCRYIKAQKTILNNPDPYHEAYGTSYPEQLIYYWVKQNFKDVINRDFSMNKEADVLIKDINLIIEYSGEYYHKDKVEKDKDKKKYFESMGYKVITIIGKSKGETEKITDELIYHNENKDRDCILLIAILCSLFLKNGYKCETLSSDVIHQVRNKIQSLRDNLVK